MDTTKIRQTIAATMLATLPLFSGVAVTHSLDQSIDEVRGLAPAEVEPPGMALGAQLAEDEEH
ncbi:hypothetical protein [Corynebacterium comes]|uniref:Uncharacterized protein n=1 Tax=Corynebacterium comes TaxID=2675218 RepID=A0A6B8W134_9CORY|nr:hypothetical protein [Corynebacterium comes]QGU05075.1 hypothetical protein CETAM_09105 [Corynebacterium comes]